MKKKVILLAGPTASGKSALALAWAERLDGAIINADSMQVYRDLRVMTARPSAAEEARVPHRLYGTRAGDDPCSAASWVTEVKLALEQAWAAGLIPIVTGGTGLYFRSLLDGIAAMPDIPDPVRTAVREEMASRGPETLHEDLHKQDPAMAAQLNPRDRQRIARAHEVLRATGRSLLSWQQESPSGGLAQQPDLEIRRFVVDMDRAQLYERCDQRLDIMIRDQDGLEEIRTLLTLNFAPALPVMKVLGVPEFSRYLSGESSLNEAIMLTKTSTRQYAKRQLTWFRNQFYDWEWKEKEYLERIF